MQLEYEYGLKDKDGILGRNEIQRVCDVLGVPEMADFLLEILEMKKD